MNEPTRTTRGPAGDGYLAQTDPAGGGWTPCTPRDAARRCLSGDPVRLVDAAERALQHARAQLGVPPWVVRQGLRKAGGTQARALVCLCLTRDGWSQHQIAEALNLSQSSVNDLIHKWAGDRDIKQALTHWPTPAPGITPGSTPAPGRQPPGRSTSQRQETAPCDPAH